MGHETSDAALDKLAKRSVVFERGYVASPLCRPSLASMVTGLYPFQHGITGNDVDGQTTAPRWMCRCARRFTNIPASSRR